MRVRQLGTTGLGVSVVGLGTWQFSGEWGRQYEPRDVAAVVDRARDRGVNLIDTAECYGDHFAEELIGAAIERDRARWIVATKFGHRFHPERMAAERWSPGSVRTDRWSAKDVLAQLEASLRALRTDYVDLYQVHSGPDDVFRDDELWEALGEEVRKGTIRALGTSLGGTSVHQVEAANDRGIGVVQVTYNRIARDAEEAVLPRCAELGLGVLVREPLANGFLTGKYRERSAIADPGDWRAGIDEAEIARRLAVLAEVERSELPPGMPLARWAIAWCLRQPAVSAVVAGAKSAEQLEANAVAGE